MADTKKDHKEFCTCLEDTPLAEMMQRMVGQKGIGSLCREMMKKAKVEQEDGCPIPYADMMRSMMNRCAGIKQERSEAKEEEGHGRDK